MTIGTVFPRELRESVIFLIKYNLNRFHLNNMNDLGWLKSSDSCIKFTTALKQYFWTLRS